MNRYMPYALILFAACNLKDKNSTKMPTYPETKMVDQTDNYFGTQIKDPYRWLENDTAKEVEDWVRAQNAVTNAYLEQIPFRSKIKNRLEEIWDYPKYSAPFKKGDKYYFFKNNGLQNQGVMYVQDGLDGDPRVFMDPNTFSEDGTKALSGIDFSNDHKYLAYSVSSAGSDWNTMKIKDLETGEDLADQIDWIKFGGAAWYKDGFFYSGYDKPAEGLEFSQSSEFQKVKYHKLGTPQGEDIVVFNDPSKARQYYWPVVDQDEKHLLIGISEGTSGNHYLYVNLAMFGEELHSNYPRSYKKMFEGFKYNYSFIDALGDKLLILTDDGAKNYRLVLVDPANSARDKWDVIIPEKEEVLESVSHVGGKLFASYLKNASSQVIQYNEKGEMEKEISFPDIGSVNGFGGDRENTELFYTYTSFISAPTIYRFDIATGESTIFRQSEFKADLNNFETKQVWYPSKDGTRVPMFITHKKGLKLDGNNPTLLYAYGGFNISITPSFSVSNIVFMEQGGIVAIPNLRGGGEFGEEWHKDGMLEKKQNVFDDFISAAEFLIGEKYTRPEKLAISGRSNGGLLIGACMTQRPELFKVALPAVGVLDMLRYHTFTVGWGWVVEYGSSDDSAAFQYLIRYSPLHNVKEGVEYPATLVTTADHDDRVVPAHSFKFIAELQSKHANTTNPVLIRIEEKAGHGAGKPTSKIIEESADVWSFVFYNLGMEFNE